MPGNIQLPLVLAEQARTFLSWLGQHSELPEDQKKAINEWVENYNAKVLAYIHDKYGHYVMIMANEVSKQVGEQFQEEMNQACDRVTNDYLKQLDKDIFGNG